MSLVYLWLIITIRYFAFGFFFWWLFYRSKKFQPSIRSLMDSPADVKQQIFEIKYSLISTLIFSGVGAGLYELWQLGWTQIGPWQKPQDWEWGLLFLQAVLLVVLHDTYFYWTHRLLHQPKWFKSVHYIHHISKKTTPWSSFSFHPLESLINALILPILFLLIPTHPYVVLWHLTLMTITGVTNHLGIEIMPKTFFTQNGHHIWVTAINHGHHHLQYNYNFGLFLTLWDRQQGTLSVLSEKRAEALKLH